MRPMLLLPALLALFSLATTTEAGRVPSRKTTLIPAHGARPDITIPYVTNGRSTLGVWQGVSPIIYSNPGLGNGPDAPQARPVYNLIYYGAKLHPSSQIGGAMPREPNRLRPNK